MIVGRRAKNGLNQVARRLGYDIIPFDPTGRGSLARHLQAVFRLLDINCVLDVGAHGGWYGRMLGEIGFAGHIVSFEPVPENFEALLRASTGNPRWSAHRLALGAYDGVATMNVARRADFSSLFATASYGLHQFAGMSETERSEQVEIARLDRIFHSVVTHVPSPRVFLKMDTQGADLEVFRGAARCLDDVHALQSEIYFREVYEGAPLFGAALAELRAAGFELSGLFPVGRTRLLQAIDADCVMVRNDDR